MNLFRRPVVPSTCSGNVVGRVTVSWRCACAPRQASSNKTHSDGLASSLLDPLLGCGPVAVELEESGLSTSLDELVSVHDTTA